MSGNGSGSGQGGDNKSDAQQGFSIDHERSIQLEVPSITKLLDRKKLTPGQPLTPAASPPPPAGTKPSIRPRSANERRSPERLQTS